MTDDRQLTGTLSKTAVAGTEEDADCAMGPDSIYVLGLRRIFVSIDARQDNSKPPYMDMCGRVCMNFSRPGEWQPRNLSTKFSD